MRTAWKTWGEAFQFYRSQGRAIDIAAIKADEWERGKKARAAKGQQAKDSKVNNEESQQLIR